jgi:hypothetical protein
MVIECSPPDLCHEIQVKLGALYPLLSFVASLEVRGACNVASACGADFYRNPQRPSQPPTFPDSRPLTDPDTACKSSNCSAFVHIFVVFCSSESTYALTNKPLFAVFTSVRTLFNGCGSKADAAHSIVPQRPSKCYRIQTVPAAVKLPLTRRLLF